MLADSPAYAIADENAMDTKKCSKTDDRLLHVYILLFFDQLNESANASWQMRKPPTEKDSTTSVVMLCFDLRIIYYFVYYVNRQIDNIRYLFYTVINMPIL